MTFRYTYNRGDIQTSPFGGSGSIRSTGSFNFGSSTLGTANTSRQRKPPERIQPNFFQDPEGGALSIAGRLIQTPGAALERPPALALNLAERALGLARQPGERSVLDRTLENIGKVGIGPLTIGGGVSALTEGLGRVGNFTSSLMNAGDALVIRAVHDLPDDTPITEELLLRRGVPARAVAGSTPYKEGVFLLGALNIPGTRGRNMTVGEYKASLEKRMWNVDPEDGTPLSWDEVARQVDEEGVNAFGNRAVNDSKIVDAAYRFSTDPLNLAFGLGAATKAANAARWAVSPAKRFLNAGSGLIPASWGVGASKDLAQIGLRASTYPSLGASVQALRNGNMAEATWQALGVALKTPKAIFLPGTGNLLTRYYRGGLRLQLGGTAVELGSGSLADMTRLGSDEDNIVSGAFAGLHDWSQAILNDHPIANDPLFTMVAAFGAPTVRVVKGDIAVTSQAVRTRLGSTTLRDWSRAFTEEAVPRSRLFDPDSPLGIARGKNREKAFLESIGGEPGLNRLVGHARLAWAFKQYIVKNPDTRMRLESLDEMLHGSPQFRDLLDGIVTEGLRQNKIKDADLIQSFKDWANYRLSTMETEAGDLIPGMSERVAFDLSPKDMLDQWMEFSRVQDGMAARFQPIAGSLLARANRMTKEDLDFLGKAVRLVEQDGKVSSRFMISQLTKHQAMFDDPGVDADFWRNLMNRGVAAKGTYDAELIISKLKELRDQAPARHELFHEKIRDESVAPVDIVSVGGPLSAQGIHPLYTPKILADARDRILPQMRVLTREIGEGQRRLDRRWNTRGNLKADAVLKRKASGLMARTQKNGEAIFDPHSGQYDTRPVGYDSGAAGGLTEVAVGDVEGLRQAALRIAAEFPDENVITRVEVDKVIVSPSHWFLTKDDALAFARAHNQRSVWDRAARKEIKMRSKLTKEADILPASNEPPLLPDRPRLALDQPSPSLKVMLESERAEVNLKREQAKTLKQELRAIERDVNDILTWRIDPSFRDTNGNPIVSGEDLFKLQEQTRWVDQNYPSLYQLERGPKLTTPWQPEDSFVTAMMQQRSNLATVLFDYGPLAKITHMLDFLTKPVNSSKMARDSRQAVFNSLLPFGFKPKDVDDFLSAMREAAELHRVGMVQAPLFRAMTALPASTINKLAHEHLRGTPEIMQAFAKKYGGTDRFHVMLDQSFNSLARRASDAILSGKKSDPLTRIFASGYWAFQRLPGLRSVSDGTRFFTKVMYPLLRFHADLRWQAQNVLEADTIAAAQDGFSATRMSHLPPSKVFHGKEEVNLSEQSVRILSERSKVSAGIPSEVTRQVGGVAGHELAEEIGAILPNARLWNVLRRQFDIQRPASTRKAIEALKNDDPLLVAINRRFGDDPMSIVDQLDDQLYGFNTKGVKATVQETVGRIAKQERWSAEELQVMQPFFNRLVDLHQGIFDDILQVHVGNVNRSRLERIMNSYWLYWPLSYQIKATKWLAGVLTDKAFGAQTNLGGLWTLNRAADQFKQQMVFNPDFRQQFKDHETIWFLAGMMFPITPFDLGVSLNRGVRYVGGNPAIGLWPEYTSIDNAGDFSVAMLKLGPIYSAELLGRVINGFTYDNTVQTESNDIPVPQY